MPLLAGVDDTFGMVLAAHDVQLTGRPTLATVFFETGALAPDAVARAQAYDEIITGSTWNEQVLREHGITRLRTVLQGVDPTLFHPAPRAGVLGDRFLVFSGGKLERRKGQDIALAAFRAFAQRHPDAMLVTAWHSPWPKHAASLDASGWSRRFRSLPTPRRCDGLDAGQRVGGASGSRPGRCPQRLDAGAAAEMDVALFPNRCEGGTNLVAMETMACGVPTILSANTGHRDLIDGDNGYALTRQAPVAERPGWGESDLDEIVAALEAAYANRDDARRRGAAGAATPGATALVADGAGDQGRGPRPRPLRRYIASFAPFSPTETEPVISWPLAPFCTTMNTGVPTLTIERWPAVISTIGTFGGTVMVRLP
jgi:glycosyltransferase involved in cell wall biosynthesis